MLNLDGDEAQKLKRKELSKKVTGEIEKYNRRIETFQHENRATLKFALTKKPTTTTSSDNSQNSNRNSSVERKYSKSTD